MVVARNTIANRRRSVYRRRAVEAELGRVAHLVRADDDPHIGLDERESLLTALAELSPREREALFLTGWDGLSPADAAHVAGCSPATFRMRLSRARRRLSAAADRAVADDATRTRTPTPPMSALDPDPTLPSVQGEHR
nr:sigma factor-like helix-turn-helix DNA-binding protein [Cellulomonas sp. APG4]